MINFNIDTYFISGCNVYDNEYYIDLLGGDIVKVSQEEYNRIINIKCAVYNTATSEISVIR